jgi:uncharacterized DUF497 family protein
MIEFEWDPKKADQNVRKHRIAFTEAATVFGDPLAITAFDPDHSTDEDRFLTVGRSNRGRTMIVAHADRGNAIRIISARELTRTERKDYEKEIERRGK